MVIETSPPFSEWITVLAGGSDGDRPLASATMYRNGRTVKLPDLPDAVKDASMTFSDNKVHVCGGLTKVGATSACFQLNVFQTKPKWEKYGELPKQMYAHQSVQVLDDTWVFDAGNVYVVPRSGSIRVIRWPYPMVGADFNCVRSNGVNTIVIPYFSTGVYINSIPTSPQSWVRLATLPSTLRWRSCLMVGSLIYVTGGRPLSDNSLSLKESYVIDIENGGRLEKVGNLLTGRFHHAMGLVDGEPAVFGGFDGKKFIDSVETFDSGTRTWRAAKSKTRKRSEKFAHVSFAVL